MTKIKASIMGINFEDVSYMLFKFFWASENLLSVKQCKIPTVFWDYEIVENGTG